MITDISIKLVSFSQLKWYICQTSLAAELLPNKNTATFFTFNCLLLFKNWKASKPSTKKLKIVYQYLPVIYDRVN